MVDLSKAQNRTVGQQADRLGDRRASILPERRDTRAPELEMNQQLRTARRGDGGAEALMRTLGVVAKGAESFQDYAIEKFKSDEEAAIGQGAIDQARGQVDEGRMQRSNGYRNAVARGRTATAWTSGLRDFDESLRGIVEEQNQLTLEERQAQVQEQIEQFFEGFAVDPETNQLRDFLATPDSMRYLAEQMQASRGQLETAALRRIEERFNEEALTHFSTNIRDQALAGGTIDFAAADALLPDTISGEQRRGAIVNTIISTSTLLREQKKYEEAEGLLRSLLPALSVTDATPGVDEVALLQTTDPANGPVAVDVPASEPAAAPAAAPRPAAAPANATVVTAVGTPEWNTVVQRLFQGESGGRAGIRNPNSSATGLGQFVNGTWLSLYRQINPNDRRSDAAVLALRSNPQITRQVMDHAGRGYLQMLREIGAPATGTNIYIAHHFGNKETVRRLIQAAPDDNLYQVFVAAEGKERADLIFEQNPQFGTGRTVEQRMASGKVGEEIAVLARRMSEDYAGGTGGTSGAPATVPTDPVVSDPSFVLPALPDSPFGEVVLTPGATSALGGQLQLTPEEAARVTELYTTFRREVTTEWQRARAEEQDAEADSMTLRLFGQGAALTSGEITAAAREGRITARHAASLFDGLRQNANMAQSYADRQTALSDRARDLAERDTAESLIAHFTGGLYSGRATPAQVRQRALEGVGRISDPAIRAAVISSVMQESNAVESLREESEPFRSAVERLEDRSAATTRVVERSLGRRATPAVNARIENIFDRGSTRLARRIRNGANAADAEREVNEWIDSQVEAIVRANAARTPQQ